MLISIVLKQDILNYFQPNQETVTTPDLSSLSSPLIDTERNLGLLLGLHASYLAKSTPLSPMELECASRLKDFLKMIFFNFFFLFVLKSIQRSKKTNHSLVLVLK